MKKKAEVRAKKAASKGKQPTQKGSKKAPFEVRVLFPGQKLVDNWHPTPWCLMPRVHHVSLALTSLEWLSIEFLVSKVAGQQDGCHGYYSRISWYSFCSHIRSR